MAGKSGFKVGDRVVATVEAYAHGVFRHEMAPVYGTVAANSQDPFLVTVVRDGLHTPERYHVSFWAPEPFGAREEVDDGEA